jgi:hypothetical protein
MTAARYMITAEQDPAKNEGKIKRNLVVKTKEPAKSAEWGATAGAA